MQTRNVFSVFVRLVLLAATVIGIARTALADTVDRVLVLRNADSPISRAVADDYARRRGVHNVLTIHCRDAAIILTEPQLFEPSTKLRKFLEGGGYTIDPVTLFSAAAEQGESIDFLDYQRHIEGPLRAFLALHPEVDFIVLTKGIPIRITGVPTPTGAMRYSLDSYIAAIDYDKDPKATRVDLTDPSIDSFFATEGKDRHARAWANKYWNSHQPFSHRRFGGYLVTRLDGYTESDAKALTTRSLEAERPTRSGATPRGSILLDAIADNGSAEQPWHQANILPTSHAPGEMLTIAGEDSGHASFDSDMKHTAARLKARAIPAELVASGHFVGNRSGLMGYISWGSNDPHFDAAAYHSLAFAPGAIAETAVSTSARTFVSPLWWSSAGGQSLIADLVSQGVTGVKGFTDEPLMQAMASPNILFDRYTRGWTLAESFYAASSLVGWQDIVIGDPLARAYLSSP